MTFLATPTIYRSSDASAPVLSGSAGSLINLLDKCLVTGYGSKLAAGWTKPFSDVPTNRASFRQGGGNQFYFDVNDNGPGLGTFKEARVSGFETMTAVATGAGQFPTLAQQATNLFVRKSTTADATARTWCVIADDRTFYLLTQAGDTAGWWYCIVFGDFLSYLAGTDNYRTVLIARNVENSASASTERAEVISLLSTGMGGHYAARSYTGLGGAQNVSKCGDSAKGGNTGLTYGPITLPSPVDGQAWIAPVFLGDPGSSAIRGKLRGFMHWLHPTTSVIDQDQITGAGVYAGHTFLIFKQTPSAAIYCIDITSWDTN